eukprot:15245828-Ditylum_brightwellii.AAC.1
MSSKGINIKEPSTENFIPQFKKWYEEVPDARDSLCFRYVKTLVACQVNSTVPALRKVVAFCQIMQSKSTKAYEFLQANRFGYASRSLQIIAHQSRCKEDLIFQIEDIHIFSRASKYVSKVQNKSRTVFSIAIDATKVAEDVD